MNSLYMEAKTNMESRFVDNPCRGIVQGMLPSENFAQIYWIMGRGANSQNRVFVVEDGIVRTEAADPSKVRDPSLIIYNAMRSHASKHVVSNGAQTDTIIERFKKNGAIVSQEFGFPSALREHYAEPDEPTFTPRISGYLADFLGENASFSLLRADPVAKAKWVALKEELGGTIADKGELRLALIEQTGYHPESFPTVRSTFDIPLHSGLGYCMTTYKPGSKELPSFEGEPFVVPMGDTLEETMQMFWDVLEPRWRVALAGKEIYVGDTHRIAEPINRFGRVVA